MFSPCCGKLMQNNHKPYDQIGTFKFKATEGHLSHMPVWKCPECKCLWAIEAMYKIR